MSNIPIWAMGLALIALLILSWTGLLGGSESAPKPEVIAIEQFLNQLPSHQNAIDITLAEASTGRLSLLRIETATPFHYHREANEILYVLRGRGKVLWSAGQFQLIPGKLLIIFAGSAIRLEREGEQPLDLLAFFTPPSREDAVSSEDGTNLSGLPGALHPMLIDIRDRIAQGLERGSGNLEFTTVAEILPTARVAILRLIEKARLPHAREHHWLYVLNGNLRAILGRNTMEIEPGHLVIAPVGVRPEFESLGESFVELLLFSTSLEN